MPVCVHSYDVYREHAMMAFAGGSTDYLQECENPLGVPVVRCARVLCGPGYYESWM